MASNHKKLSIAFYWHMHQPVYQLSESSDFLMPWVRLHAVKDYYHMARFLDKFDNLKLNFNLVPALVESLRDYSENNFMDLHAKLSVQEVSNLSDSDKEFVINNFFDANYQNFILPNYEYNKLFQKKQTDESGDISIFSDKEISDLMALFNLSWFDKSYIEEFPQLKKLFKKGKNYTTKDRIEIINLQKEIISRVIPTYKRLLNEGKIEITTSPYYHPIIPLLLDISSLSEDFKNKNYDMNMEDDARLQVGLALDEIERTFGVRPKGMWPSEQCISGKELELFKEYGINWTITDEGILSNSINFNFVRDFRGYLEDPYHLLKTYSYKTTKSDIKVIFRDSVIPNLINFEYHNHDGVAAANDLYDRIKVTQNKLLSSPDENHLLTIAMDGENCWENYTENGNIFLETLYNLIEQDESLETVLISDYIGSKDKPKQLNKISSGSWLNRNFKLWVDEPIKNAAWMTLKRVHDDFCRFKLANPDSPNLFKAQRELLIAEGSDWFWWFGEPNDSGRDNIFDYMFREHLKNMYLYIGETPPKELDSPLLGQVTKPSRFPKGNISPKITGKDTDETSWLNAGCIDIPNGPVMKEYKFFDRICFGYDKDNMYLRFYINRYDNKDAFKDMVNQMYLYTRAKKKKHPLSSLRVVHKLENILPISKEKFHNEIVFSIYNGKLSYVRLVEAIPDNLWVINSSKGIEAIFDNVLDVKIPFDNIDVGHGETVEFLFVNAMFGIKDFYLPNEMLLTLSRE